jgi:hypothetical protein
VSAAEPLDPAAESDILFCSGGFGFEMIDPRKGYKQEAGALLADEGFSGPAKAAVDILVLLLPKIVQSASEKQK